MASRLIRYARARLANLLSWSARDWREIVEAERYLLRARLDIRRQPSGELLVPGSSRDSPLTPEQRAAAERLAKAVRRAADFGPIRGTCLPRSLALQRWLDASGIHGGIVRLGARTVDGKFEAHAWVMVGDVLIGDRADHIAKFKVLNNDVTAARQ